MPDMLVKLYCLESEEPALESLKSKGIVIRRAIAPEKHIVANWVLSTFGAGWASECEVAFTNHPSSCFIAIQNKQIIGFACYDATCKNFFGPTGISQDSRGHGVGKALLLACLNAMKADGYAYAIIGGVGPVDFYAKAAGATIIEGSVPGIYEGMLKS